MTGSGQELMFRMLLSWSTKRYTASQTLHQMPECPFETLGLNRTAKKDEIRAKYRELAKKHHPDVDGGNEEKFKKIHTAYEECNRRHDAGFSGTSEGEWGDFKERASAQNDAEMAQMRENLREHFQTQSDPDVIDELLDESLACGAFHNIDCGEPLVHCLQRFHVEMGLGPLHWQRCLSAINRWEEHLQKRAGNHFYHILLTHYTNEAYSAHIEAQTLTEIVTSILETMSEKGLKHDDWTLVLANRAFRTSPWPDW